MTASAQIATLGRVLPEFSGGGRLLVGSEEDLGRPLTGISVLTELEVPDDPGIALIYPVSRGAADLEQLGAKLVGHPGRMLVLTGPSPLPPKDLAATFAGHVVLEPPQKMDAAAVAVAFARMFDAPEESVTRRLASLQRSFTQVLGEPDPVKALLARLKRTCNATAALVDKHGRTLHSTGPLPLTLLFDEVSRTSAETQLLALDGWYGVADRLTDPAEAGDHMGWLIVAARRDGFPDAYAVSAVHVAAALVEASQRMTMVARQQERAIRAAVLEEALALYRTPDAPELAGRIASLGLGFDDELHVAVVRAAAAKQSRQFRGSTSQLADNLSRALEDRAIAHLVSAKEEYVVVLVQASAAGFRRALVASHDSLPSVQAGIGRTVRAVGEVTDSFHDAQLAMQTLRRSGSQTTIMTYDDFDFATRLFADVGTDRMIAWARKFLAPLEERPTLMAGLSTYFEHNQNMNAAADALSIHHNSLRYRLAKAEELLHVSLRDPAAISSLFLALSARNLPQAQARSGPRATGGASSRQPSDVTAARTPAEFLDRSIDRLGVVLTPGT